MARFGVGIALGAGIGSGQIPWSVLPFSLFFLFLAAAAFLVLRGWKPAAMFGWAVGIGYFASTMFWIVEPFLVDPVRHGWMAPFALTFMVGGLALFWALGFGCAAAIGGTRRQRLVALVVALGLAELLRSYVFTGFPWGLLGYIWLDTPMAQLAGLIGPHGLGAFTLGVAVLPLAFWRRGLGVALSLLLLGAGAGIGVTQTDAPQTIAQDRPILRLVQPNAQQHQKWDPQYSAGFFERQIEYTAAQAANPPDLIIWPEASFSFWLDDEPELQNKIVASAPSGSTVIVGAQRHQGRRFYNSLVVLGKTGLSKDIYDKSHLVPFGEYVPFGWVFSRFGIYGLAAAEGGGFTAGSEPRLMDLGKAGKILPLICYEAIFPHLASITDVRPDWILQITNDAWYGKFAGPQQHMAQARMRAIEQGLPLVRVANTGISAVIDANGVVTAEMPLGHAGYLDANLPVASAATIYSQTGDWAMLVLLLLSLGLVLNRAKRI